MSLATVACKSLPITSWGWIAARYSSGGSGFATWKRKSYAASCQSEGIRDALRLLRSSLTMAYSACSSRFCDAEPPSILLICGVCPGGVEM